MELTQQDVINPASLMKDIELTATLPIEMVNSQQQLITWCDMKLHVLKFENNELEEATAHAKKMKWKFSTLQIQYNRSLKHIQYYEKVKNALMEGYYIVPNFPIQMFAIKTTKKYPTGHSWSYWGNLDQKEQELGIGKGDYKNPAPIITRKNGEYDGSKEIKKAECWTNGWDEFEFPITMARPKIMEATSRAMALKIFDRIGIMPATRNEDPVIIGQVVRKNGYTEKVVSFMIAWHLNTNVI